MYIHPPAWQDSEVKDMIVSAKNKAAVRYRNLAVLIVLTSAMRERIFCEGECVGSACIISGLVRKLFI